MKPTQEQESKKIKTEKAQLERLNSEGIDEDKTKEAKKKDKLKIKTQSQKEAHKRVIQERH